MASFNERMTSRKLWFGILIFLVCARMRWQEHLSDEVFGRIAEACVYAYALANVGAGFVSQYAKSKFENKPDINAGD